MLRASQSWKIQRKWWQQWKFRLRWELFSFFLAVAGLCLVEYRDRELISIDLEKQANKTIYKCALNTSKAIHWYNNLGWFCIKLSLSSLQKMKDYVNPPGIWTSGLRSLNISNLMFQAFSHPFQLYFSSCYAFFKL